MVRDREQTTCQVQQLLEKDRICPNEVCPDFGKTKTGNITKYGHTDGGRQRYLCRTCGKTFTATRGTPFYLLKTNWADIIEALAAVAMGAPPEAIAEAKKIKVETVLRWIQRAGKHAEAVEEILLRNFRVTRVELDERWSYVKNKGEKRMSGNRQNRDILVLESLSHAFPAQDSPSYREKRREGG